MLMKIRACLRSRGIIELFFFNGTVSSERYLNWLQEFIGPQTTEMFGDDGKFFFQQDEAPPHYHRDVRDYLDAVFSRSWIERRGFNEYPPRSPNLTPMYFFLGILKRQSLWQQTKDN